VDKPCAEADTEVKSNQLNLRQSQVNGSTNFLVDSKICLELQTNSYKQAEKCEVSLFEGFLINSSSSRYRSLEDISYHSASDDTRITEQIFFDEMGLHIFKTENSPLCLFDMKVSPSIFGKRRCSRMLNSNLFKGDSSIPSTLSLVTHAVLKLQVHLT
jgi:hypothetical protein